ncbi:MAG TPA: AbrB/MazE/SpoVT family DNA-binding domain-containing protein [Pyrinomonadaceae bacterium]|nr:AbrB/MazE/SpoVT family DNA-binding domain-containing protein [Pyrinomonadaceae bacterium]
MIVRTKVTQGGRIVIPAGIRKRLGIKVGESVTLEDNGSTVTISSSSAALRWLQESLKGTLPEGVSLADELIAERLKEAASE